MQSTAFCSRGPALQSQSSLSSCVSASENPFDVGVPRSLVTRKSSRSEHLVDFRSVSDVCTVSKTEDSNVDLRAEMSCDEDVNVSQHLKHKRLKTSTTPSSKDENDKPTLCYCFEKSECVVRKLRAERLKASANVRRKLDFGPVENTAAELSPFAMVTDESSKVWNFDFNEETPLPGHWIWVKEELPVSKSTEETEQSKGSNVKHRTIKDLFRVSKNRTKKRSLDSSFRLPLTPIRSTETSPA